MKIKVCYELNGQLEYQIFEAKTHEEAVAIWKQSEGLEGAKFKSTINVEEQYRPRHPDQIVYTTRLPEKPYKYKSKADRHPNLPKATHLGYKILAAIEHAERSDDEIIEALKPFNEWRTRAVFHQYLESHLIDRRHSPGFCTERLEPGTRRTVHWYNINDRGRDELLKIREFYRL